MRWGLIARPETDRGLGIQTRAIADNLHPDVTYIIDVADGERKWRKDFDYPGETFVVRAKGDNRLPMGEMSALLSHSGLDALVTVEAWYDDEVVPTCRRLGIHTANQMNAEFYRAGRTPMVDDWWWPTKWRPVSVPQGPLMPVPVPWVVDSIEHNWDRPLRVLHIVGKPAYGDRNGTRIVAEALEHLNVPIELHVATQESLGRFPSLQRRSSPARIHLGSTANRRELYEGMDILLLPRRYGGLSLQVLEAIGSGLLVLMPDCVPNADWPILPLDWDYDTVMAALPCGPIKPALTLADSVVDTIEKLDANRDALAVSRGHSRAWALNNTWEHLGRRYLERLEYLCA